MHIQFNHFPQHVGCDTFPLNIFTFKHLGYSIKLNIINCIQHQS